MMSILNSILIYVIIKLGDNMRKFLIGLLVFILINVIGLLILSFTLKNILVDGIVKEVIVNQIDLPIFETSNYQYRYEINNDENINKITNDERVKELLKSDEVTELIDKYMDKIIDGYIDEEKLNEIELEKDMINYLENNKDKLEKITGQEITQETIDQAKEEIKEMNIDDKVKESIKSTRKTMPKETIKVLKGYKFFISLKFKLILFLIMIIDIVLIALLQKSIYKWIKLFAISLTTNGIFTLITGGAVYLIVYTVTRVSFNIKFVIILGIIITILGILIQVVYDILTKNKNSEEVINNEVSQIS